MLSTKFSLAKYKFGEISPGQSKSLKFCTLVRSFCKYHVNFQLKKYRRLISHERVMQSLRKTDLRFQLTCGEFSLNHLKAWKFQFDGLFLSKVYEVWAKKIEGSFLYWHWTVMQNFNRPWPCGFKNCVRNWVSFH